MSAAPLFRHSFYGIIFAVLFFTLGTNRALGAGGVREVDLSISSLIYDPFTQKLYGASSNNLLQVDADSGQVLRTFDLGSPIVRLVLGAGNGLWAGLERSVRRFNLQTLSAETPIAIDGAVFDVSASLRDPQTIVVSTPLIHGRYETVWAIRNGAVLPDSARAYHLALNGSFLFGRGYRWGIVPNGVSPTATVAPWACCGLMKSYGDYVYNSFGQYWHAATLDAPQRTSSIQPWSADSSLAINTEANSVYYLTDTGSSWDLNRFEHLTFNHTGHHSFPRAEPKISEQSLAAWSTNRAAYHTSTKLYLLETDKLFVPPELEITHTITPPIGDFGTNVTITIAVTNKGFGSGLEVTVTNRFSDGYITFSGVPNVEQTSSHEIVLRLGTLAKGAAISFPLKLLPTKAETVSLISEVRAKNLATPIIKETTIPVHPIISPVAYVPIEALDLAYDPVTRKLFYATRQFIGYLDPDNTEILAPGREIVLPWSADRLEIPRSGGNLYATHLLGMTQRFETQKLELGGKNWISLRSVRFDLAASPIDTAVFAVSDESGPYFFLNHTRFTNSTAYSGDFEFSPDGTRAYFIDHFSCDLQVLSLAGHSVTVEQTHTNVSCSGFTALNGLLYFDSGLVFNPVTGAVDPQSLNLQAPSFVIPRDDGTRDILTRTNGVLTLQRIKNSVVERSIELSGLPAAPIQMIGAGADNVALRTSNLGFYLVSLADPTIPELDITRGSTGGLTLRFNTAAGSTYRIEQSQNLTTPTWATLRDNIAGGSTIVEAIAPTAQATFYRIQRLVP